MVWWVDQKSGIANVCIALVFTIEGWCVILSTAVVWLFLVCSWCMYTVLCVFFLFTNVVLSVHQCCSFCSPVLFFLPWKYHNVRSLLRAWPFGYLCSLYCCWIQLSCCGNWHSFLRAHTHSLVWVFSLQRVFCAVNELDCSTRWHVPLALAECLVM